MAGDAAIVASLGHPAYDLFAAGDRPRNFYTWGSMGLASSIGLGLALARPDLRVFVARRRRVAADEPRIAGDDRLLHPPQSRLIVMDNEEYATTGGQPTPTAHGADLDAAARAMRVDATTVRTAPELDALRVARPGSLVVVAKVTESAPTAKPPLDCVFIKHRFMTAPRRGARVTLGRFVGRGRSTGAARAQRRRVPCSTPSASRWPARSNPPHAASSAS